MDTLNETSWDVVISGTGLPQSLLALALSRSGKKILHVDRNDYYGGDEAALSLSEAERWAEKHAGDQNHASTSFSHAEVITPAVNEEDGQTKPLSPRAYSLALAPQLLYSRSILLPALVSSRTHNQLEFQAVGSWFIIDASDVHSSSRQATLMRVPGGREDIFRDDTLDLKKKRALMKFLRFVTNHEEQLETWQPDKFKPFSSFLEERFGLPTISHGPIVALALTTRSSESTTVEFAVPRVAKHLSCIGVFGPGFGAVIPKWGGLAEISQVACRASAVGGGVYVLGRGITDVQHDDHFDLDIHLSNGEKVVTQWLVGLQSELPGSWNATDDNAPIVLKTSKSINIVSSSLNTLFPPTSEGGVTPAGAVVLVPSMDNSEPPVHVFVHSSDAGECPTGQCVLYAAVAQACELGYARLDSAVANLLAGVNEQPPPRVLWKMRYEQWHSPITPSRTGPVIALHPLSSELSLEDAVLEDVRAAWAQITQADPAEFMKFEAREGTMEDID